PLPAERAASHLRLSIYPDGGVSRLRVWGQPILDPAEIEKGERLDLAARGRGACITAASDTFFGAPERLLLPGRPTNMGDGWETRRRRGPGHDWVVIRLGTAGLVERIEVDTTWFKGNAPEACSVEGFLARDDWGPLSLGPSEQHDRDWRPILPRTALRPDHRHRLDALFSPGPVDHVRFSIYPDGGVGRLRVIGRPASGAGAGGEGR
ncbi:MAG: hypothetical protein MI919_28100, partial [Holophagales bacterium]|nr:hypothetical protein [Holophagales bacterium]